MSKRQNVVSSGISSSIGYGERPSYSAAAVWFLGGRTAAGLHEAVLTFTASTPGPYVYLCPLPGHAAEGGYDAELPEPRGEGGDSHTDHGPVVPAAQTQPARPRYRDLARINAQMPPALSITCSLRAPTEARRGKAATMRRAA